MLAGTVWRILFLFCFPCHTHGSNPFRFVPPLLKEGQSSPSLNPQLRPGPLPGEGKADLGPRPSPSQRACGVSGQDSPSPSPCSVLAYSPRLPCPGLKVLFVPTLAKAHSNPKLSPLPVWSEHDSHAPTRGRGEQSQPSARDVGFAFCSSGEDDVLSPQHRLWTVVPAWQPVCQGWSWQPGLCCPCARARRHGEEGAGGDGAGLGIQACVRPSSHPFHSAFLIKI